MRKKCRELEILRVLSLEETLRMTIPSEAMFTDRVF
jgi:hypothetical protein